MTLNKRKVKLNKVFNAIHSVQVEDNDQGIREIFKVHESFQALDDFKHCSITTYFTIGLCDI